MQSSIDLNFAFYGVKLISTNDMYIPTSRGKTGRGAFLRRSDSLKEFQSIIDKSFEEEFFYNKDYLSRISSYIKDNNLGLLMELKISIPYEEYLTSKGDLSRNDTSNLIKAIEDSIYKNLGIDDSRNIKVIAEKGYNEDGSWYVEVNIKEFNLLNRIDVNTVEQEVFINE